MAAEYAKACVKTPSRFLNFWLTRRFVDRRSGARLRRQSLPAPVFRQQPSLAGGSPMKLYTSVGPNPRVVKMFLAEKGLDLPRITVDLMGGENRRAPYNEKVNPAGQTPALQLDDGSCLTEILPICEYIEEKHPSPPLIGTTPEERAKTRMWTRRVDLKVCEP